jgi:hypothetical protein
MLKILYIYVSILPLLVLPQNLNASDSKQINSINEIVFYCEPAKYKNFFCTNSQFDEAELMLYLHRLERKKVNGTVDAFRIMPSIHNLTQKNYQICHYKSFVYWQ